MALSTPVKAIALLLFVAALAAATYGVEQVVGGAVEGPDVSFRAPRATLNATAGQTVTYVVNVTNHDAVAHDVVVRLAGAATGESVRTTIFGGDSAAVFVPVAVPATAAPGEHPLTLSLLSEGKVVRVGARALELNVLPPGVGLATGDQATALYVGRLAATGRVFDTNDPMLRNESFPATETYRFSPGVLPIRIDVEPNALVGLYRGMLGMQAGETRTISVPADLAFGPSTVSETLPRDEIVPRRIALPNDATRATRLSFEAHIRDSGQGDPASFGVGDTFTTMENGNVWRHVILDLTNTSIEYRLALDVGEKHTIYAFWPNASAVVSSDERQVVFETTPTTEIGEPITYRAYWPRMSTLAAMNETSLTVRHSPPEGFSYTRLVGEREMRTFQIASVNETSIVATSASSDPLAGRDLVFDVTILSITRGS